MATATLTRPATKQARKTDKVTSKVAATDTKARKSQRILLLEAFVSAGTSGLTAEEAGDIADLLHTGYWKRVSDLLYSGMITEVPGKTVTKDSFWGSPYKVRMPKTRVTSAGRSAAVFKVTAKGKDTLKKANKASA
jgi:hypothetical protein